MGGVSGTKLFFRQLHLALLFARNFRRLAPQLVWTKTQLVATFPIFLSRVVSSLGAGRISGDLLLLSRRLLQGVLGGSAGMHSRRAAKKLLGRAFVPVDHAERSSLLSLRRALLSLGSSVRCLESAMVCGRIWNRHRHHRVGNQSRPARRLYFWLPLAAAPRRWLFRSILQITNMLSRIRMRGLF